MNTVDAEIKVAFVETYPAKFEFLNVEVRPRMVIAKLRGTGMAQWLEHRTRDRKVASPRRNGGRMFFSGDSFLC